MIPFNASVKLARVPLPKYNNYILYFQLRLIFDNHFRGRVVYCGSTFCLVVFRYPPWFIFADKVAPHGLFFVWIKYEDLQLVCYSYGKPVIVHDVDIV